MSPPGSGVSRVKTMWQFQHYGFRQKYSLKLPRGAYTLHARDEIRAPPPIFICSQKRLCVGYLGGRGRGGGRAACVELFQTLRCLRNKMLLDIQEERSLLRSLTDHMFQLKGYSQCFQNFISCFVLFFCLFDSKRTACTDQH